MKNYIVWKILGVVPLAVVFLLWQLGGYSIWVFMIYGLIDLLFLRPALNVWRLRKLGVNDKFSFWQLLTLNFTHTKTLWGVGKGSN
jgi:small-conductance mechanosensitive channel